jgi:hypothetical protein
MNTQNRVDVTPVQIHADHAVERRLGNWTAAGRGSRPVWSGKSTLPHLMGTLDRPSHLPHAARSGP